ncbi:MAG: DMT family transporter [Spirochaetales bacterium]|nr:DMT family transporter [Spirochaetales bacterium]
MSERQSVARPNWTAYAALGVTTFGWGTAFVATKVILAVWPPWGFMGMRFAAGALVFLGFLGAKKQLKIDQKLILPLGVLALFQPVLYFVFETLALERTSAGSASIIIAAIPGVVALASGFFLKEHLSARGWFGAFLSILGIGIMTFLVPDSPTQSQSLVGNLFALGAVLAAVVYTLLTRHLSKRVSSLQLTGYQMFYAGLFFFPGLLVQGSEIFGAIPPFSVVVAFGFLVLVATFGAFLGFNYALSRIPAPQASMFLNGIPVVTVVVGWLVLGETLTLVQGAGGGLALLGVMLAGTSGPNRTRRIQKDLPNPRS